MIDSVHTCVIGSFIIRTSVTVPNIPKYSLSFSLDVCQLKPPTNNFPGAISALFGVDLPELPPFDNVWVVLLVLVIELVLQFTAVALTGIKPLCKSCSTVFASMTPLKIDIQNKTWNINCPINF